MEVTLPADVELHTAEMLSKETKIAENRKLSAATGKSKEVAEDINPLEATQPTATTFVETKFRSAEQTQPFVENIIAVSDADSEAHKTAIPANNGNMEIAVEPFENISITESDSQTKMFGSIPPNNPTVEDKRELVREDESIGIAGSRIPSLEFTQQPTTGSEGLNSLHRSTTEESVNGDMLSSGSGTEIEFHGSETAEVDNTERESIITSVTRTVGGNEVGKSSAMMSPFGNAGIVKFNEDPKTITNGSAVEAKSGKEQDLSEGQSVSKDVRASYTYLKGLRFPSLLGVFFGDTLSPFLVIQCIHIGSLSKPIRNICSC